MALDRGSATPREESETLVEASRDLVGAHHASAGRGELDREGDPIETPTELCDRRRVLLIQVEVAARLVGALGEELDRMGGKDLLGCRALAG